MGSGWRQARQDIFIMYFPLLVSGSFLHYFVELVTWSNLRSLQNNNL